MWRCVMRPGWSFGRARAGEMRAFLIAGEPSGDALGQALMAGLKTLCPEITFDGIGGTGMAQEGLRSRFDMSELSVMGIAEILPKYRHLKRRIRETAEAVLEARPDVVITIDSPDFCLRVAKLVKAQSDIRIVHYVAPSVWAWRPGRAQKMAAVVDQVLALLPFEPPYLEAAGVACDFVGHPVAGAPVADAGEVAAFRAAQAIGEAAPLMVVLPGSRRGEVRRIGPVFGDTLGQLRSAHPGLQAVLVVADGVAEAVAEVVADWPVQPILVAGSDPVAKRAAFAAADVALAASGTVALDLAAAGTPMVIGYRMNPLTFQIIKRMALIDSVNLVNIVTQTRHVPECLGPDCTSAALSAAVAGVIADPEPQRAAMHQTMDALGRGGAAPGLRAARAVMARMP